MWPQCSAVMIASIAVAAASTQLPSRAEHELTAESQDPAKDEPNRVLFSVPANPHGQSANGCKRTPNFAIALRDSELGRTLADHLSMRHWHVETVLRSVGEDVQWQAMPSISWFWRAGNPPFAACVARCIVLPEYARTTRITLTGADGHSACAQLQRPTLELPAANCTDQTQWLEVISEPIEGRWVACGVVLNKSPKKTSHRMLVEHEYQAIQIGNAVD